MELRASGADAREFISQTVELPRSWASAMPLIFRPRVWTQGVPTGRHTQQGLGRQNFLHAESGGAKFSVGFCKVRELAHSGEGQPDEIEGVKTPYHLREKLRCPVCTIS